MEAAQSMQSMASFQASDVVCVSRLTSANHDLIIAPPPPANPIVRFSTWWASWAVPGMGMFSEAYIIFSIGNITPLLEERYPNW